MNEPPPFRSVLRGYDPDQVSAALTELSASLTVARRTAAERTMELTKLQQLVTTLTAERDEAVERLAAQTRGGETQGPFVEVGARVSAILSLASEEARDVRSEAERHADELRRSAEAEAHRMKSAAAEAADEIVRQASQDAAATREANAAGQAQLANAEQAAAQIIESARGDAELDVRRARADVASAERARNRIATDLGGVLEVLAQLELDLADDVTPTAGMHQREAGPAAEPSPQPMPAR
jgi:cell division septum initiation protein DivIVA